LAVSITPDGKRALSGSEDKTCILWNLETGQAVKTLTGHTSGVNAVSITPDGKRALSGSNDKTCILWDLETGLAVKTLSGHTSWVNAVSITPDGKRALSGSWDNTCILWDLETGLAVKTLSVHTSTVRAVAITPDGKRALSGSWDNTCILWDLETGKQMSRFVTNSSIYAVTLYSQGVVLGCNIGKVIILNVDRNLLCPGKVIVTIKQIWDFELERNLPLSADCPICGNRFEPPHKFVKTIEMITKKAGLRPEQSPCLELPDEAWEDPGLLENCPKCGEMLKFNPFIVGGEEIPISKNEFNPSKATEFYKPKPKWKFWKR
ncbi:MAG: WD40 repeat domain-containing protein, partial [Bacteroidia bacterium]|nr:WD40 repeat domain-containing protein [Bacteroidia bacterium]